MISWPARASNFGASSVAFAMTCAKLAAMAPTPTAATANPAPIATPAGPSAPNASPRSTASPTTPPNTFLAFSLIALNASACDFFRFFTESSAALLAFFSPAAYSLTILAPSALVTSGISATFFLKSAISASNLSFTDSSAITDLPRACEGRRRSRRRSAYRRRSRACEGGVATAIRLRAPSCS